MNELKIINDAPISIESCRDPLEFLQLEYTQLFNELRAINTNIATVAKYYGGLLSSLIIFTLIGLKFHNSNNAIIYKESYYIYALIGLTLTITLYFLGLIGSRQYAVSKKHRVRYWKSIHNIRRKFQKSHKLLEDAFLLPVNSSRPHISSGEVVVPYVFAIINILFSCIGFWYVIIIVAASNIQQAGTLLISYEIIVTSSNYFSFFMITILILLPENCIYFSQQLYLARKISSGNPYPKFPTTNKSKLVHSWKKHWLHEWHIVFVVFIFTMNILNISLNDSLELLAK